MKTKSFQIGNYIIDEDSKEIGVIVSIDTEEVVAKFKPSHWTIKSEKILGVPISTENILKIGFIKYDEDIYKRDLTEAKDYNVFYLESCNIYIHDDGRNGFRVSIEGAGYDGSTCLWTFTNKIDYVHQLQNVISSTGFIADA